MEREDFFFFLSSCLNFPNNTQLEMEDLLVSPTSMGSAQESLTATFSSREQNNCFHRSCAPPADHWDLPRGKKVADQKNMV